MELWKVINGLTHYEVSTCGRVRNAVTGKILIPFKSGNGYLVVNPSEDGIARKLYVHRLVAEAFIPTENTKLQVNHINGVKSDNGVNNLEWCTSSENHLHRARVLGVKSDPEHMNMMQELARVAHYKPVVCVETDTVFNSVVEAAKSVNRDSRSIVDALKGRHKTCAGFHWRYYDSDERQEEE